MIKNITLCALVTLSLSASQTWSSAQVKKIQETKKTNEKEVKPTLSPTQMAEMSKRRLQKAKQRRLLRKADHFKNGDYVIPVVTPRCDHD